MSHNLPLHGKTTLLAVDRNDPDYEEHREKYRQTVMLVGARFRTADSPQSLQRHLEVYTPAAIWFVGDTAKWMKDITND